MLFIADPDRQSIRKRRKEGQDTSRRTFRDKRSDVYHHLQHRVYVLLAVEDLVSVWIPLDEESSNLFQ